MTSRLLLKCAECGAYLPAEPIADRDSSRLFGCCSCGYATVEFSFSSEIVGPSSRADVEWRDVSGRGVVSFSCG